MTYKISWKKSAVKDIKKLDILIKSKILKEIKLLISEPRPNHCIKLKTTSSQYRVRIGDYRVIYLISDSEKTIIIMYVRHRSSAYRNI